MPSSWAEFRGAPSLSSRPFGDAGKKIATCVAALIVRDHLSFVAKHSL